mgnify:CR=1 FL=1
MSSNGARITLVAKGVQDVYLMGEPNSTYFKQTYQRHTNFAMATINQVIEGAVANGTRTTVDFGRISDLLSYIYIFDNSSRETKTIEFIDKVELLIGGQVISEMTQNELYAWEAYMSNNQSKSDGGNAGAGPYNQCVQPLHFWFCDNWGAALPLCALQNSSVKMNIYWKDSGDPVSSKTWVCKANYIFLDNDERRQFTQAPKLEYLIQQWQRTSVLTADTLRVPLEFNHPILSLFLMGTVDNGTILNRIKVLANGNELFKGRLIEFAKMPYWHTSNAKLDIKRTMFPFCLDIASCQPSGSCNFSRLDNVTFVFDDGFSLGTPALGADNVIHAVNWNVLKIAKGMGGLTFAN